MARHSNAADQAKKTKPTQRENAEEALDMKNAAGSATKKPDERTAHHGLHPIENKDQAPSGALDHGGQHPAMQRGKFARQPRGLN